MLSFIDLFASHHADVSVGTEFISISQFSPSPCITVLGVRGLDHDRGMFISLRSTGFGW